MYIYIHIIPFIEDPTSLPNSLLSRCRFQGQVTAIRLQEVAPEYSVEVQILPVQLTARSSESSEEGYAPFFLGMNSANWLLNATSWIKLGDEA